MHLNGSYNVKLGKSLFDKDSNRYMTMRCDFMPTSVDKTKPGSLKVIDNKEVVLNMLNVANSGPECTFFRGIARPVQKECILIFNKKTQELTLERISHTVQLKKTREERKNETKHDSKLKSLDKTVKSLNQATSLLTKKTHSRTLSCSSSDSDTSSVRLHRDSLNGKELDNDFVMSASSSENYKLSKKSRITTKSISKGNHEKPLENSTVHRKLIEHDLRLSDSD